MLAYGIGLKLLVGHSLSLCSVFALAFLTGKKFRSKVLGCVGVFILPRGGGGVLPGSRKWPLQDPYSHC
jgi:hypothetical protein